MSGRTSWARETVLHADSPPIGGLSVAIIFTYGNT